MVNCFRVICCRSEGYEPSVEILSGVAPKTERPFAAKVEPERVEVVPVTDPVQLGESPHWDSDEEALYFVSILDKAIHRYKPSTGEHTKATLEKPPTFIIPVEGKSRHFAVSQGRKAVEVMWDGGEEDALVLRTLAEVDHHRPENSLNGGKADPRGRLFAGSVFGMKTSVPVDFHAGCGSLYRIDPDSQAYRLDDEVSLPNGLCWDVERNFFYFTDSLEYAIRRYDYDVETGNLSNCETVFRMKDHNLEGICDGITIDTDGNIWAAIFEGEQILKIDPRSGQILQEVRLPVPQLTSLTFGGPNSDILYVTSANTHKKNDNTLWGCTFKVTGLGVRGYPNLKVRFD
ncbi:unnamed protein product, partial [Iphiclides podalirius]